MHKTTIAAVVAALLSVASAANATSATSAAPADDARRQFQAIASGDVQIVMR